MEYACEYCGSSYLPKRADSRYCSHTCRQLAYVLRKAKPGHGLNGISQDESEKISVRTDIPVRTDAEKLPVKTDPLPVNEHKENMPVQQSTVNHLTDKVDKEGPEKEEKYKEYLSPYLEELAAMSSPYHNLFALHDFFLQKIQGGIWVSERYRCLLECLLIFSEMREIDTDDLKEVCNAFTDLIQSRHFKSLHPKYPYLDEIRKMRERLKKTCIGAGERISIKYRLNREEKQRLIIIRLELAQFVHKKPFQELNFRE